VAGGSKEGEEEKLKRGEGRRWAGGRKEDEEK
jgi:hypothetical protein